ncbi:MAG TPA: FxSxx-COOH system tetratricopeptide repeat protein [Ktedonobacteraceae bacterium]|nr:FxSxx-COOH system tetratricopeptide repeat protein [Ktedonobacteraceae bacterium]
MDESAERTEASYSIRNEKAVQGQVTGDRPVVNQYFYGSGADKQHPATPERLFTVPYRRNPLFTGREQLLIDLHTHFTQATAAVLTQPPAITGLGGIGKTQLAVEYAYRYREDYHYVPWANASERVVLSDAFVKLARDLQLPERDQQDQTLIVEAVKRWLSTHDDWLLILDNADDLTLAADFMPSGDKGHLLLTTREAATGRIAKGFAVDKMSEDEGVLFLLRRAHILTSSDTPITQASENDQKLAAEIVREMDGLPLALEQAGAYIDENQSSLADYLKAYRQRQASLLGRKGRASPDYPNSVATTWSLSFEQVEKSDPTAAELLRFLAFLAPDAIPEELIVAGASELGPQLEPIADDETLLNEAIGTLRRYSLVHRNIDKHLLAIHRLVQTVLKTSMAEEVKRQWVERAVRAIHEAFPDVQDINQWAQCERYIPHALMCAALIDIYTLEFSEAALLLNQTAYYLSDHAQYKEAESLLRRGLEIDQAAYGPEHPEVATTLNNLAELYRNQGRYEEAEPLYQRSLEINQAIYGPEHPAIANNLNNLALLYNDQGKYEEAEPLYQRALEIDHAAYGLEHPAIAKYLNNLALLYNNQGKYEEAEPLYKSALKIDQEAYGLEHPDVAKDLNNLALLYYSQDKYEEAEPLYQRAFAIWEQMLGPAHPLTATSLNNLALLYYSQGKYEEAEPLFQRALDIDQAVYGPEHPDVARDLNNLAGIYRSQGKYEEAEPLLKRAFAIYEQVLGPTHPNAANCLNNLAELYGSQGKYEEAEPLFHHALAIWEHVLGPKHPNTIIARKNYDGLLAEMKRNKGG